MFSVLTTRAYEFGYTWDYMVSLRSTRANMSNHPVLLYALFFYKNLYFLLINSRTALLVLLHDFLCTFVMLVACNMRSLVSKHSFVVFCSRRKTVLAARKMQSLNQPARCEQDE